MGADPTQADTQPSRTEELAEVIRSIQERVRTRHPNGSDEPAVPFPDLLPLLHARDAAEGRVAAIGRVNPRPPGPLNAAIQWVKNLVARALDWHVRDQVDFNRGVIQCVQATIDVLDENNRALSKLLGWAKEENERLCGELTYAKSTAEAAGAEAERQKWQIGDLRKALEAVEAEARELKDIRKHWAVWREAFETQNSKNEIYLLRTVSELQHSFQHRLTLSEESTRRSMAEMEEAFRGLAARQHDDYRRSLEEAGSGIQERLWKDLDNIRLDFERLIHNELRTLRQRAATLGAQAVAAGGGQAGATPGVPQLDWLKFADRFRGSEEKVRAQQAMYVEKFAGARDVLDIGCGRGEFLDAALEASIGARGIDLSEESVALCRAKGLDAEVADLFAYLPNLADGSLGGVYCSQVVEHIAPERLPDMIRLIGEKVRPGGLVAFETPNPECLAIFASHFYLDPTHTRPVPSSLMAFYLEEAGFGHIEVRQLAPAVESWPQLEELPEGVRERFFGGLDYVVFGRKL